MKKQCYLFTLLLLLIVAMTHSQRALADAARLHTIEVTVSDKDNGEAIIMATCVVNPLKVYATTNLDGKATITNVPEGNFTLAVTYVGYEESRVNIKVTGDQKLTIRLTPSSLALKEVVVTAKQNNAGQSTSSLIGRQAIDHLQATSLADIMQLVPGQLMGNKDLTSSSYLQLRTPTFNSTGIFGTSVVVDGMPMTNNAELSQGAYQSTVAIGTDLRTIAADNIDNVEVIRGIPSAEYGDLTSGLVVVHSKLGVTPYQVKAKIDPKTANVSVGKGLNLGRAGILNLNFDYAKAWSDPREKTHSYGRYTFNGGYGYDVSSVWHTENKLNLTYTRDWNGNDPDVQDDGTFSKATNFRFSFNQNGRLSLNRPLARTLTYTVGLALSQSKSRISGFAANSTGLTPILTARETGYYEVPWLTTSYLAEGITESRPGNVYAKVSDAFYVTAGKTRQSFKVGADYSYQWNSGRGYYNGDDSRPYRPNSNGRPRAFSDVPGLHSINAFAEDNFTWTLNDVNRLRATLGVRFQSQQPFTSLATTALSPRINASFTVTPWLAIRAGFGLSSKAPGLAYLYPDKEYDDRVAANYMPQDAAAAQLLAYHTEVYDVVKSRDLKNATTTKWEAGLDVTLPWGGKLSLLAYHDKTPNGFGPNTQYFTYYSDVFTATQGLNIQAGQPTTIDYSNPARHDLIFMTTGAVGNTNSSVNRGVEMDFNLGEIKPIHTTFILTGAYQESKSWSTDENSASVRTALLPADYSSYGLTPFKVIYPSGEDYEKYRRFLNTLQVVTHIPALKMVASFTAQAIWYNWSHSFTADKQATGWIGPDLARHAITSDQRGGFIGFDGAYYATQPTGVRSIRISDFDQTFTDAEPVKDAVTWNMSARLTKEIGRYAGLSLYVNNCLFYEPYLKTNKSSTLTQRNTGSFSFGAELYINL